MVISHYRKIQPFYKNNWRKALLVATLSVLAVSSFIFKDTLISFFSSDSAKAVASIYYIAPNGSDTNAGTADKPFATFKYAFTKMQGGDTLLVADGTYNQNLGEWKWQNSVKVSTSAPPSGTAGNYTTVKGQNVRGIVNGIDVVGSSYVKIEGFKSLSKVDIDESNHIELRKIGAKGGIQTARSSYVTKEDVWGWDDNRYVIHNFKADHVIDNRVIARLDQLGSEATGPVGAISHYLTDNSVIANALIFDVTDNYPSKFAYDLVYSSRPAQGNDQIWGLIGFNPGNMLGGIYPGDGAGSNYEIHNSTIWGTTQRCVRFNSSGPLKVENTTCGENGGSAITSSRGPVDVNNNIFYNNGGGVGSVGSCDNNLFNNSGTPPAGCTNSSTENPNIKWLPRSPVAGKGATIEKRYNISEVNGKFMVTESTQKLWPWPYEDLIKQDMCEGVTKGWCGTNKTLTQYVWEYLGTPCPTDICSGTPAPADTTKPTAPIALSAAAVSTSQIDLTWTASTDNVGVTGYRVYRDGTQVGTTSTLSYSDKNLNANTSYTYTVLAYDGAGNNSDQSSGATATTKSNPPGEGECTKTTVLCVDDTAGGTQEYSVIQAAATAAKAGDTVLVYEGSYAGFQVTTSGTQTSPIVFKTSGTAVITSGGPTGDGARLENVSYVTVEGFKIENVAARCVAARGAIPTNPMKEITIKNNTCYNSTTEGFYLSQVGNSVIENNTITSAGKGIGTRNHGFYLANAGSDNTIIRNNIITKSNGEGLHVNGDVNVGGDGLVSGLTIEKNIIYNNLYNGLSFDGVQDSLIQNNIVYDNARHGLRGYDGDGASGPKNLKVINNTFSVPSTGGWPIKLSEDGGGHVIFNNILLNESANGSIVVGNTSFTSNNNIIKDKFSVNSETSTSTLSQWQAQGYDTNSKIATAAEVFINPASSDYHLKDLSKAIDIGAASLASVLAPAQDREGNKRPQGVAFDSGAYEKAGTTTPPPGDTTPPSGTVVINNGAATTNSTSITLTLSATDTDSGMGNGAQMQLSNDNLSWSTAESYATTKDWTLGAGDGIKTVYVRFKDAAGNWMISPASDTITVDNTGPVISNVETIDLAFNSVTVTWKTNELGTSQVEYGVGASGDYTSYSQINPTLTTSHNQTLTGLTPDTVYHFRVRSKDVLNNQSFSSDQVFTTPFKHKKSDLNKDKKVDQFDFDTLKQDFGRTDSPIADMNRDGVVNAIDLGIMMSEWDK